MGLIAIVADRTDRNADLNTDIAIRENTEVGLNQVM